MNDTSYNYDAQNLGYPTFISDGIIGELYEPHIRCIVIEKALLSELISEAKLSVKYWNDPRDLRRLFVICGGNFDLFAEHFSEDMFNSFAEREHVLKEKTNKFMKEIHSFNDEVVSCGGVLAVTSLIPQPSQTDPDKSGNSLQMQEFISRLFVKINDEIWKFNSNRGFGTLSLKDKLEVRPQKKKGESRSERVCISGRNQKKIRTNCYKKDNIYLENFKLIILEKLVKNYIDKFHEKQVEKQH